MVTVEVDVLLVAQGPLHVLCLEPQIALHEDLNGRKVQFGDLSELGNVSAHQREVQFRLCARLSQRLSQKQGKKKRGKL